MVVGAHCRQAPRLASAGKPLGRDNLGGSTASSARRAHMPLTGKITGTTQSWRVTNRGNQEVGAVKGVIPTVETGAS